MSGSAAEHVRAFLEGVHNPKKAKRINQNTIFTDKWDREDYSRVLSDIEELDKAEDKLAAHVETGEPAMRDAYASLFKGSPRLLPPGEIESTHLINRGVMEEAMGLDEYAELRVFSTTDVVASALSCVDMEPELEILFDKLKEEQEAANGLGGMEGEYSDLAEEMEGMASEPGEGKGGKDSQAQTDAKAALQEAMEKLQKKMEELAQTIDEGMQEKAPEIKETFRNSMKDATDKAETIEEAQRNWGLDPGGLHRVPVEKRLELARKVDNEKFRKIAKLFGPLQRLAIAQQQKKVKYAPEEIHHVEQGSDLNRLLPSEFLKMKSDVLKAVFFKDLIEGSCLQYHLEGTDKVARGNVIFCEDGSGSMSGGREIWAKAVSLALLQIARMQKRNFSGIHFGSPGEFKKYDFNTKTNTVTSMYNGQTEEMDMLDGVISWAETFFCGGTDFMTPLTVALEELEDEHRKLNAVKADIVFCTDGECGVDDKWLEDFKKRQEALGFRVWGVAIDCPRESEPLWTICDGKVFTIADLLDDTSGIKEIFGGI